jgi:hypothetical protein
MKKGVELSMNVIVIAAIVLIILVLLVMFVTGAFNRVKDGTGCAGLGGSCTPMIEGESCADMHGAGYTSLASDCPNEETCCIQAIETEDY